MTEVATNSEGTTGEGAITEGATTEGDIVKVEAAQGVTVERKLDTTSKEAEAVEAASEDRAN